MNWVWQNREWIFSGGGITAILAVVWMIRYVRNQLKPAPRSDNSEVSIAVKKPDNPPVVSSRVPTPRSSLTPSQISEDLQNLAPYLRRQAMESYKGIHVSWPVRFEGMQETGDNEWDVHVTFRPSLIRVHSIFAKVSLSEYPQLKVARTGDQMTVAGTIDELLNEYGLLRLRDAEVHFN